MESIRIHSLDSLGLLSREGASRLCEILDREQEEKQVVVVSPVQADGFEIYSLLESARNHDERLWATCSTISLTARAPARSCFGSSRASTISKTC